MKKIIVIGLLALTLGACSSSGNGAGCDNPNSEKQRHWETKDYCVGSRVQSVASH